MFIHLNSDGTIAKVIGSRAFKKSNGVNTIALFAPFSKESSVLINFLKPDGIIYTGITRWQEFVLTEGLNLWTCQVNSNVTEIAGRVDIAIEIRSTTDDGIEVTTSALTYITVEESIGSGLDTEPIDEYLDLANAALSTAQTATIKNTEQDVRLDVAETTIDGLISTVTYTAATGVLAFAKSDGTMVNIDLPLELIIETGTYDSANRDLVLNLANGQIITIPVDDIFSPVEALETRVDNIEIKNTEQDNTILINQNNMLKKDGSVPLDEGYEPYLPKHIADVKFVQDAILGVTGQDLSNIVTPTQLAAAVDPVIADLSTLEGEFDIHNHDMSYEPKNTNIQTHISSVANPHVVTKAQVGLGSVNNWAPASQAEAEAGTSSIKYMTPWLTSKAITALHASEVDNPHAVSKSQVGLGSVGNYGIATQAEAEGGTSDIKYMTPLKTKQAINSLVSNGVLLYDGKYTADYTNNTAPVFCTVPLNVGYGYLLVTWGWDSGPFAVSMIALDHFDSNLDASYMRAATGSTNFYSLCIAAKTFSAGSSMDINAFAARSQTLSGSDTATTLYIYKVLAYEF